MKISVVTVCYNAVNTIEKTISSVINQTYSDIEYIIIDGGSKDGTIELIKKYADYITYWVSESDSGIYHAMNKGIEAATGEWINFMNSGDIFATRDVIQNIFASNINENTDIIYGNSIIQNKNKTVTLIAGNNISLLRKCPIYRHGASFVRLSVHKLFLFNLARTQNLGYALDFDVIFRLYRHNKHFEKVDTAIMIYEADGISNHPFRNIYYNYRITHDLKFSLGGFIEMLLKMCLVFIFSIKGVRYLNGLIRYYIEK